MAYMKVDRNFKVTIIEEDEHDENEALEASKLSERMRATIDEGGDYWDGDLDHEDIAKWADEVARLEILSDSCKCAMNI